MPLPSAGLNVFLITLVGVVASSTKGSSSIPDGAEVSLTKLITSGQVSEAQDIARVNPPLWSVESYAHFFTVDEELNSNMFFWYFPVTSRVKDAPLLLWLQGGPGASSLLGLFNEHGPVSISPDLQPVTRNFAWNKEFNVLYLDNPVGAGFSYTESESGYAKNMDDVGKNLYNALIQFLVLFPDLQKNPFFIAGESYAGKYIPTLGHFIHKKNPTAPLKVNLQGLAIGNGFTDPPKMLDYSNYFFQIGLIDQHGKAKFEAMETSIKVSIAKGDWKRATALYEAMMQNPPVTRFNSLFTELTGFNNVYNYLSQNGTGRYWIDYVNQPDIRNAIHVYDRTYSEGSSVRDSFEEEMLKSVKHWVEELLGYYRILIYTGELDCIVPSKQVHDYTRTLVFKNTHEYHFAHRHKWYVGGMIGGYVRTAGRLTDVVVRNAGHMVPMDQPALAWDLMKRFVNNWRFADAP